MLISADAGNILPQFSVNDRRSDGTYAGCGRNPGIAPGRCAVPQILYSGVVVQRDPIEQVMAAQLGLVGVAQIGVIHTEVIIRMGISHLG